MTMLVTILLVGIGSYVLRVAPLLLVERVRLSPRTEELLGHAVLAAMAALLSTVVRQLVENPPTAGVPAAAPWIGLGAGAAAALLGQPMGRVALSGMAGFATVTLLAATI